MIPLRGYWDAVNHMLPLKLVIFLGLPTASSVVESNV
jgi:hypothetical protein